MKPIYSICIAIIIFIGFGHAQQPDDPNKLPDGPLLAKFPPNTQCVITRKNLAAKTEPNGEAAKPAILQRQTIVHSGSVGYDETVDYVGNRTTKTWTTGGYSVMYDSTTKEMVPSVADSIEVLPFPGMGPVSARNFTGITSVGGRKCMSFKLVEEDTQFESKAIVDLLTRLPMSASAGEIGYAYQFSAVSDGAISVPVDGLKAINALKSMYNRASLRAP